MFISDDGVPVLADFGLATWIENDRSLGPSHDAVTSTTTASLRGTPRWIAPELLLVETSKSSSESDVWALGCFILVSTPVFLIFHDVVHPAVLGAHHPCNAVSILQD